MEAASYKTHKKNISESYHLSYIYIYIYLPHQTSLKRNHGIEERASRMKLLNI